MEEMRATLIWPAFEDFSDLDATWIPHSVTQLATEANARGHEVDILDGRLVKFESMKMVLADTKSEVVGISMLSSMVGWGKEVYDWLRVARPDIKIVLGGIHGTVTGDFDNWGADWLVKGEGEIIFPQILDGSIPEGIHTGETPDLAEILPIDRDLIRIEEKPMPGLEEPFATVIIGRGCPYQCTFCWPAEEKLFGKRVRFRPVNKVVKELESLDIKSFMVHDDCFTANKKYLSEFLDALPDGLRWWCQGRADNVCDNLDAVKRMRDKGLRGMILGHESGDPNVLQMINKGVTREQNIEATKILRALEIITWSNIMLGLPGESPSAVLNTISMVHESQPDMTSVAVFTPHPGSHLYDVCREYDLMPENPDWTYYNRGRMEPKIKGPDYAFLSWATQQIKLPEIQREAAWRQNMSATSAERS